MRAAYAAALRATQPLSRSVEDVVKELYPDDRSTLGIVSRAAVSPATTTGSGWANTLTTQATGDFVASLVPTAAAKLIGAGTRVSLTGLNTVSFPRPTTNPTAMANAWVAEGAPHPVAQFSLTGGTLGPMRKLEISVVLTKEMVNIGGEPVVETLLLDTAGQTIEAAIFSANAASSARPAGLLNGITAVTATSGGGEAALRGDLLSLVGSIASGNVVLVANAKTKLAIQLLAPFIDQQIWVSAALVDGMIVALDPLAFVSGFGPEPRISASPEAVVNLDDSAPAHIGTTGTPPIVAAPVRSAWQTDCVVIRVTLDVAFTMRVSGAIGWLSGATWD